MRFDNASRVLTVVQNMRDSDVGRSSNRALINNLFNGFPPYTAAEAAENNIQTNVNFLEGTKMAHDARSQFNNAFLKPGRYFNVTVTKGPVHKTSAWGRTISKHLNRIMKGAIEYTEMLRSQFANVVLHGPGPVLWQDKYRWVAYPIGMDDFMVPSGTRVGFGDMDHFAVFTQLTAGQLFRLTHGSKIDKGWNMATINSTLAELAKTDSQNNAPYDAYTPEKVAEQFKANQGFFDTDAVPTVKCWDFYFKESEKDGWYRRLIFDSVLNNSDLTSTLKDTNKGQFLYSGNRPCAQNWKQLIHVQYGDGANVAMTGGFQYHSVRSLGFMLYAVCHLQNRLRCRFTDSVFENLLWMFYVANPDDRDRLQKIDLHHMGIIPEGVRSATQQERPQINSPLVEAALSQMRQLMSENSASFTQDINDGTRKEMTATETLARVNSINSIVSAMLNLAYTYQTHQYTEICRRFCLRVTTDLDVKKFRKLCLSDGVPEDVLDAEHWEIEPERIMGQGNKVLELLGAKQLMEWRSLYDPEAQQEILHIATEAVTDDPKMAERLAPIHKKQVSDAVHDAQLAMGTLMLGLPIAIKSGLNHIEYIETLLAMMGMVIGRIEQRGGMASEEEIVGLGAVAQHIEQHIEILGQNEAEKARVKSYSDVLGKLMNKVKAYVQRLQEQQQAQGQGQQGLDPEAQSKIISSAIIAKQKAENMGVSHAIKTQQRQVQFQLEQQREQQQHDLDMARQLQQVQVDTAAKDIQTEAEILNQTKLNAAKAQGSNDKSE